MEGSLVIRYGPPLDVFGNAATVKIVANEWIDYLHVSKIDGRWVIVNVLWEMKPRG